MKKTIFYTLLLFAVSCQLMSKFDNHKISQEEEYFDSIIYALSVNNLKSVEKNELLLNKHSYGSYWHVYALLNITNSFFINENYVFCKKYSYILHDIDTIRLKHNKKDINNDLKPISSFYLSTIFIKENKTDSFDLYINDANVIPEASFLLIDTLYEAMNKSYLYFNYFLLKKDTLGALNCVRDYVFKDFLESLEYDIFIDFNVYLQDIVRVMTLFFGKDNLVNEILKQNQIYRNNVNFIEIFDIDMIIPCNSYSIDNYCVNLPDSIFEKKIKNSLFYRLLCQ